MKTGVAEASLAVTWLILGIGKAVIPHLKEGNQGYMLIQKLGLLTN